MASLRKNIENICDAADLTNESIEFVLNTIIEGKDPIFDRLGISKQEAKMILNKKEKYFDKVINNYGTFNVPK